MYPSVRAYFIDFSIPFESKMTTMYLDVKGLVTCGVGNLIDPISEALKLPWLVKSSGQRASQDQISAEWRRIKALVALAEQGAHVWAGVTTLFLSQASIDALVLSRLDANDRILSQIFNMAVTPADAQLAVHSMAWAMGPNFHFPLFSAACAKKDWAGAAAECKMDDSHNAGLIPRNKANFQLLMNAAQVEAEGMDRGTLYYPQVL